MRVECTCHLRGRCKNSGVGCGVCYFFILYNGVEGQVSGGCIFIELYFYVLLRVVECEK